MEKNYCPDCLKEVSGEAKTCPHCGFHMEEAGQLREALPLFTVLADRYLLGRVIGQGGFGITYAARDLLLDLPCAVKELFLRGRSSRGGDGRVVNAPKDSGNFEKLKEHVREEARILALFREADGEGIVSARDVLEAFGTVYLVMEYVRGTTLRGRIAGTGPLSFSEMKALLGPVERSCGKLHALGVVHGDVSPDNIMIREDGFPKLLDFGSAWRSGEGKRLWQIRRGYAAPEQYGEEGQPGPWTDVYALAATCVFCLTGETVPDVPARRRGEELPELKIPKYAQEAIRRGLMLSIRDRWPDTASFRDALGGPKRRIGPAWPVLIAAGALTAFLAVNLSGFFAERTVPEAFSSSVLSAASEEGTKSGGTAPGSSRSEGTSGPDVTSSGASAESTAEEAPAFDPVSLSPGTYVFRNASTGDALCVPGNFPDNGAELSCLAYEARNSFRFAVIPEEDGTGAVIRASHTNSPLTASGEDVPFLTQDARTDPGLWTFEKLRSAEDGTDRYRIREASGDRYWTVLPGGRVNLLPEAPADPAQRWILIWEERNGEEPDVLARTDGEDAQGLSGTFLAESCAREGQYLVPETGQGLQISGTAVPLLLQEEGEGGRFRTADGTLLLHIRYAGYNRFTIGIPGGIELLLGIDPESGSLSARSKEEWGSTESVLWFLREVPPETAENP